MGFLNTILNIVFPEKCLSCGKSGTEFCLACLIDSPSAERETAEWIYPLYDYRHPPIKKALWLLKYKGKISLAKTFGEVLHGRMLEELSDLSVMENFTDPVLIPIPLSKQRRRERGYNQAELLCKEIKLGEVVTNVLTKPKETEHQARIENRAHRLKNIIGSFEVQNAEKIKNRNIILIDDITTTGATLSEAKKILKNSGAKKVIAFTVAH